jgi:cytochrome P450
MGRSMTGVESKKHARQRRVVGACFGEKGVQGMMESVWERAGELVRVLKGRSEEGGAQGLDVAQILHAFTVDVIGSSAFGVDLGALAASRSRPSLTDDGRVGMSSADSTAAGTGRGQELLSAWKRMMAGNNDSRFMALLQRAGLPLAALIVRRAMDFS